MIEILENVELKRRQECVYIEFKDKVTRYVRGKMVSVHDTEDLVSDVFVKVFNGLADYDESRSSLSTWIYTITRNTVIDYFRKAKCFCEIPDELCLEDDTEEGLLNEEALEQLANALENLEERERDLLLLHYYKNKSLKEIARIMGMSYSNTRIIHKKALDRMKQWMESDKKTAMPIYCKNKRTAKERSR